MAMLLDAIERNSAHQVEFHLTGDGPERQRLEPRIQALQKSGGRHPHRIPCGRRLLGPDPPLRSRHQYAYLQLGAGSGDEGRRPVQRGRPGVRVRLRRQYSRTGAGWRDRIPVPVPPRNWLRFWMACSATVLRSPACRSRCARAGVLRGVTNGRGVAAPAFEESR